MVWNWIKIVGKVSGQKNARLVREDKPGREEGLLRGNRSRGRSRGWRAWAARSGGESNGSGGNKEFNGFHVVVRLLVLCIRVGFTG